MKEKYFKHFNVAGFTYCDGLEVFDELKMGKELLMVLEPENRHDPDAVALYYKQTKIGYIPRDKNKEISTLLSFGHTDIFEARINRIKPDAHPEEQIGVVIRIKNKL